MTIEQAKRIIEANYSMQENSLSLLMYDECVFSTDAFWVFYDAISYLVKNGIKNEKITTQIVVGYQRFLKEIIWHFDPNDIATKKDFPENYNDYIERLDYAVRAYLENNPQWLDDKIFVLQRNMKNN